MNEAILATSGAAVFFPVRHHSPAAARLVRELARQLRPSAILIEGPADFNARLDQLALPHQLPIAIYSYVQLPDDTRRSAFYPFCSYSPEWQALQAAAEVGAQARFIDLPWAAMAAAAQSQRYADGELRRSGYIPLLCLRLGVESFDDAWDLLFEVDPTLDVAEYMRRCHLLCYHARIADDPIESVDLQREAFMAAEVRRALDETGGPVLVVTGGFHSYALFAQLHGLPAPELGPAAPPEAAPMPPWRARGIALTPYSYQRLDSLTGYEAGMPNPGFYHQVWHDRAAGQPLPYRRLLGQAALELRRRGQIVSTADLIAVESGAQSLASLRGHSEPWRRDLIDAIIGGLVKDELAFGLSHPFLDAVHAIFRGSERGVLAEGTDLPPLVHDLRRLLDEHGLTPEEQERTLELELRQPSDLARSRVLHQLRLLGIDGFTRTAGTDLAQRDDLAHVWERWRIRWSPSFEASSIEAAIYGSTLADAAGALLQERAGAIERSAEQAALLVLDAALAGLDQQRTFLAAVLAPLILQDASFLSVASALGHLLYLFRYDDVLGAARDAGVGALLAEAFRRGLWLLESVGLPLGSEQRSLRAVGVLVQSFEACGADLQLSRPALVETLQRVSAEQRQRALLRGAASGALWTLRAAEMQQVLADLRASAAPDQVGDFLTGLFTLAREVVQRTPDLLLSIDALLLEYDEERFLQALPALRLAFSFFTPREKHYLAATLLQTHGIAADPALDLTVSPELAALAQALEGRVLATLRRYGLRGGTR